MAQRWHAFLLMLLTSAGIAVAGVDDSAPLTGKAPWRYRIDSTWGGSMAGRGSFHGGIAIAGDSHIIVSSDGPDGLLEFTSSGALVRAYGKEWSGIHELRLSNEGGEEFLYAAHLARHQVVKLRRDGTPVWTLGVPPEPALYPKPDAFKPTSVAVADDGLLFVSDGYGRSVIHRYDAERRHLGHFGDAEGPGKLKQPHGILLVRDQDRDRLLVADRANRRLVLFERDGTFVRECARDLLLPSTLVPIGDHLLVGELQGRLVILDRDYRIVSRLGDSNDESTRGKFDVPPERWTAGHLNAPHGLAVDAAGAIYVAEWNRTGRLHRLERIAP